MISTDQATANRAAEPGGSARNPSPPTTPRSDRRTHVLFLIDQYLDAEGGAEGALLRMTRHLPKERFRCSVATFRGPLSAGDVFDCPFYHFPLNSIYNWQAMKTAWKLRGLIRRERVDIVHTFFETSDLWGGLIAKSSFRPKLISSRRDMGILRGAHHSKAYRWLGWMYDQVHAVSNQVREFAIREDALNPDKVVTVHNGIELERPERPPALLSRDSLGLSEASHVIFFVGNIRPVKGLDVMIRAAAIVCREYPRACFAVAGKFHRAEYEREAVALRDELGLTGNVRFLGRRSDVDAILPLADVFCLPSRSEGMSNSLLEAMANRLPSVVTRVGGNAEVVEDGRSGFIVESEDSAAMAERLLTLLRDPALARSMGNAAREILEQKFTMHHMIGRLVQLYDDLLQR